MCSLEQRGRVFVLTLTGTGEHRLNPDLISSLRSTLASIRSRAPSSGSALVTAAEGNFFSNGFDLAWARGSISRLHQMTELLLPLLADLISLPMPTVVSITGHAAAAGLMLALAHDHHLMRRDRGVLYMSELDIGLPLPPYFMALLRDKVGDRRDLRDVVLRAAKIRGEEAAARGIVDRVVGSAAETLEAAVELATELAGREWKGEIYASTRKAAFPEVCRTVGIAIPEGDEEELKKVAGASKL